MGAVSRRSVLGAGAALAAPDSGGGRNILIAAHNGMATMERGHAILRGGGDTLDAAIAVVSGPEDDPNDHTVGLGGLPNEDGVVELDASCMHGPTRQAGAVGAVRTVRSVASLARAVMRHTGHVMLVGEGADRFAAAMGFKSEPLLTDAARRIWLLWKEYHSSADWWGPGLASPDWKGHAGLAPAGLLRFAAGLGIPEAERARAVCMVLRPPTGTIHCSALSARGEMSGVTTTSGLAYKLAGRLGDTPIIGAGCYTDQDIGSAGATGSGEENIKIAGAHTIVENMRRGWSPHDAAMDALRRIVRIYDGDMARLRYVDMTYYVLRRDGAYAGVSLWQGYAPDEPHKIAVHDGTARAEPTVALLQGYSQDYPPFKPRARAVP